MADEKKYKDLKRVLLTGMWKHKYKDENIERIMLSGGPKGAPFNYVIFPNTKKQPESKDPDYFLSISERPKEEKSTETSNSGGI